MGKRAKVKFAFKPYDIQQEILDHVYGNSKNPKGGVYRFFVAALGRQAGKSWLAKYALLDRAINHDELCWWVAPSNGNARKHWNNLVNLIHASGMDDMVEIKQLAKEIHFADGGQIHVRSALEGDNLRGEGVKLLVLDEAAFYRDGKDLFYGTLLPSITASRGVILLTTTPNGRNWVYDLYRKGQDATDNFFKSWNMPSVGSPYQDKELLEVLRTTMPSLQWREEFMAEFLADGGGVFAGVDIAAKVAELTAPVENADMSRYVAGIDIGFNNDYTCFTVVDKFSRKQVYGERFTSVGTIRTVKRIMELLDLWQPEVTYIEKNGVGEFLLDLLKTVASGGEISDIVGAINDAMDEEDTGVLMDNVGTHRIVGVHMDNNNKRKFVERLSADIEYRRFEILREDVPYGDIQISEMSTFERKPTNSGMGITYEASSGSHDDTIIALYLAYSGVPKIKRKPKLGSHIKTKRKKKKNPFNNRGRKGSLSSLKGRN